MKLKLFASSACFVLALPLAAQGHASAPAPDPADAGAAVPAFVYTSAMAGQAPAPADSAAKPDKTWRRANDALLESMEHEGHGEPQPPAQQAKPAAPAPVDHSKHHHAKAKK